METQHSDRTKELKEFDESKAGVKGLSDSKITSIPRIFVHPPESLSDLVNNSQPSISIPVIDLSSSGRPDLVDQVKRAAKEWGFFQVINHGIPLSIQNDTISAVKSFFELPVEAKAKHYKRLTSDRGVMYTSNFDLFRSPAASWHDLLQVRQLPEEEEEVPMICRREILDWFPLATSVAEVVLELLSEGLGLERGMLYDLSFLDTKIFNSNYYPHCPEPDRTVGLVSHTDGPVLSVLMQNQVAGLQVKHDGVWVDVKPQLGGLVVNIGDFFQIASNGEYKSVQHRVLANSCDESRISVTMFYSIGKWKGDGYYGPLPELLSPQKPPIYRNFTKNEFIEAFSSKALGNKSLVERVKI